MLSIIRCRWTARFRTPLIAALVFVITSCDNRNPVTAPDTESESPASPATPPSLAIAYSGGMPFGLFMTPTAALGSNYNATVANARLWLPQLSRPTNIMLSELAAIKARGGKVVINLAGGYRNYLDENGRFSLTKWKARLEPYKTIPFGSYINDGTIIAHKLIDEPNDRTNWGGVPVSPATVEEMARYSKQFWPNMATVTRAESSYLAQWSGTFRYLDAAWAQYVTRKGTPEEFIQRNVADAKKKGLALITGLNVRKGDFGEPMSPSLIKTAGSVLLSTWYPCAFISWEYHTEYLATPGVTDALKYLRAKALNRTYKSCKS
ncbi:MAG TPA: hypothetical protein VD930_02480 [Gemmatimonadales bacterium]|nr:hypothetical protein [Gemmatimonadales bacterium]